MLLWLQQQSSAVSAMAPVAAAAANAVAASVGCRRWRRPRRFLLLLFV